MPTSEQDERALPLEERGKATVVDAVVLGRIVDTLYPLLNSYYANAGNSALNSLTDVQLAQVEAFQGVSGTALGGVTVDALAMRMSYTNAANFPSEGPPDPREDVQDMLCEGSLSATDTAGMILAVQSACLTQKCNATPKTCKNTVKVSKRRLDEPRDYKDFHILKRYFDQVRRLFVFFYTDPHTYIRHSCIQKSVSGASSSTRPTMYNVINAITSGALTLLEFSYFNVSSASNSLNEGFSPTRSDLVSLILVRQSWLARYPIGRYIHPLNPPPPSLTPHSFLTSSSLCHPVIFAIGDTANVQEYAATATRDGWANARDPDRVVVIHFHFGLPPCNPSSSGTRVQIRGKCGVTLRFAMLQTCNDELSFH